MRLFSNSGRIHVDKMFGLETGKRVYSFDDTDILPLLDFFKKASSWRCFLRNKSSSSIHQTPITFSIFSCTDLHRIQRLATGLAFKRSTEIFSPQSSQIP